MPPQLQFCSHLSLCHKQSMSNPLHIPPGQILPPTLREPQSIVCLTWCLRTLQHVHIMQVVLSILDTPHDQAHVRPCMQWCKYKPLVQGLESMKQWRMLEMLGIQWVRVEVLAIQWEGQWVRIEVLGTQWGTQWVRIEVLGTQWVRVEMLL